MDHNTIRALKTLDETLEKHRLEIKMLKEQNNITLRDHFAGMAMQKIIDSYDAPIGKLTIVKEAYEWADAMLVERNKDERNTLLDK